MGQQPVPAAEYLRMSTEMQQYSIENQKVAIRDYAARHGFTVVQSYADAAKSGVVLRHRHGLRSLIRDVVGDQLSTRLSWCTTSVVGVAFKIVMKQPIMSSSAPESKERRQPPQIACGVSHTRDLLTRWEQAQLTHVMGCGDWSLSVSKPVKQWREGR